MNIPQVSIVSDRGNQIQGDFEQIHSLLKNNPLYDIPDYLRLRVLKSAHDAMCDPDATPACRVAAGKLVLLADKLNIDILKLAIPKQVVHRNVRELSDEELEKLTQEFFDVQPIINRQDMCEVLPGQPG